MYEPLKPLPPAERVAVLRLASAVLRKSDDPARRVRGWRMADRAYLLEREIRENDRV